MANETTTKTIRDKAIKPANVNADPFSLGNNATTVIDLHPFMNNKAIQVNSLVGTLTMKLSWDGKTWSNSSTPGAGITAITTPCRYVQLSSSNGGSDSATGLVGGTIY